MTQICVCGLINHPNNPDLYLAVADYNKKMFDFFGIKYD